MAIHSHSSYNWTGVDGIDAEKGSLMDANTSIDPTFSQSGSADDASFTGDHVAQAVATAQAARKGANASSVASEQAVAAAAVRANAAALAGRQTSPGAPGGTQDMDLSRQGRPLTNTKRAQQNRQAQRAFRQRKELYIKDLEAKVNELKQSKDTIDALRQENIQLRDYILALQSRLIEHPAGVPTPPAVYARQTGDVYGGMRKAEK